MPNPTQAEAYGAYNIVGDYIRNSQSGAPQKQVGMADISVSVGGQISLSYNANDYFSALSLPIAYSFTWNGQPLPSWLTHDAQAMTVSGTVPAILIGNFILRRFAAVTNAGQTYISYDDADVIISPSSNQNAAPVVSRPPTAVSFTEGQAFSFSLAPDTFSDANNDALTITAQIAGGQPLPAWITFTPSTLGFSSTGAPSSAIGARTIEVTADDGNGDGVAVASFSLTIAAAGGVFVPLGNDPLAGQTFMHGVDDAMKLVPYKDASGNDLATHWTRQSGPASDPNTWAQGSVPGDGAIAVVKQGHTFTFDIANSARWRSLRVDGVFEADRTRSTILNVEHFVIAPGGTIRIGTLADPFPEDQTFKCRFIDDGPLEVVNDVAGIGRGFLMAGHAEINGAMKSAMHRSSDVAGPLAGATTMTLETAPAGWRAGDQLVIRGTNRPPGAQNHNQGGETPTQTPPLHDLVTLNADPSGAVLNWTGGLANDHAGTAINAVPYTCFVDNLTRNVTFESESQSNFRRGHSIIMHTATGYIQYAAGVDMGRTNKDDAEFSVKDGSEFLAINGVRSPTDNIRGRYIWHLHHTMEPFTFKGLVGRGSMGWIFTQHGGGFHTIEECVAHDAFAVCFMYEDGNERGISRRNSGGHVQGRHVGIKGTNHNANNPFRFAAVFGWHSRNVLDIGNRAADAPSGHGSVYFTRNDFSVAASLMWIRTPFWNNGSGISNDAVPLRSIDFECCACERAFFVLKAGPVDGTAARPLVKGHRIWNCRKGHHYAYTGHYNVIECHIKVGLWGIEHEKNVLDFTLRDNITEGCFVGIVRHPKSNNTAPYNTAASGLIIENHTYLSCTTDIDHTEPEDQILATQVRVPVSLTYTVPHAGADTGRIPIAVTITDTYGPYTWPQDWERVGNFYPGTQLGWANNPDANKGWYDYSGEKVTVYPFGIGGRGDDVESEPVDFVIAIDPDIQQMLTTASRGTYNPAAPIFG